MNKKYCISKKILVLSFTLLFILVAVGFFSLQNQDKKVVGSKAKEPNRPAMAPSVVIRNKLTSCANLTGASRMGCLSEKLQLSPDKWDSAGKGRLIYHGQQLKSPIKSGARSTTGKTQVIVGPIYASDNLSHQHIQKIKSIIQSWNNENISKEIVMKDDVILFDSSLTTNCMLDEYWTSLRVYYPDALCEDVKSGENTPIGYQTNGSGGVISYSEYVPLILVDKLNADGDDYTIKHEFGHLLGSEDNDFVEIAPNTMFAGNSHNAETDPYNDIMYNWRLDVKEITKYQIEKSPSIHEFFDVYNTANWNSRIMVLKEGKPLLNKRFKLYAGRAGTNHFAGAITDSPVCEGSTDSQGNISLCKEFLVANNGETRYVAGFMHFMLSGIGYVGKFDALDLIMSLKNQTLHTVQLEKERVVADDQKISLVTFVNLVNDQQIASLGDIRIRVSDIPYLRFKSWSLGYRYADSTEYKLFTNLKGGGKERMDASSIAIFDIPTDFVNNPGKYELILNAKYQNPWSATEEITVQKSIMVNVDFSPKINSVSFNSSNITVSGTGLTAQNHKARLLIDNADVTPANGYHTFTDNTLITGLGKAYGNKMTTVQLFYPDIKTYTNLFTYTVSNQPLGIVALIPNGGKGSESKYTVDKNSSATVRFDFTCNDNLYDVAYGLNTTNNLLDYSYMKKKLSCNKGERVIDTFKVPYSVLSDKKLFGEQVTNKVVRFVCSPMPKDSSIEYSAQTDDYPVAITSWLNKTRVGSPFSQCETEAISFELRSYN